MAAVELPEALDPFYGTVADYLDAQAAAGAAICRELSFGEGEFASQARLYEVGPDVRTHLQGIAHEALHAVYLDEGKAAPKKWPMPLFKLINPQGIIANYSIHSYRKYRDVRTPEKVFKRLQGEKAVLANLLRREQKKYPESATAIGRDIAQQQAKIDMLIQAYDPEAEAFEGYEVRLISKARARYFGDVQWRENGRQKKVQLTSDPLAVNIIVYDPTLRKTRPVDDFMHNCDFHVRDIYVKKAP